MWSFGCVLAEMLIGRPLFAGDCAASQFQVRAAWCVSRACKGGELVSRACKGGELVLCEVTQHLSRRSRPSPASSAAPTPPR